MRSAFTSLAPSANCLSKRSRRLSSRGKWQHGGGRRQKRRDGLALLRGFVAPRHLSGTLGARVEYVDGDRIEEALADSSDPQIRALWRRTLGIERPVDRGFYVATADDALVYTSGGGLQTEVRLPFTGRGWLADPSGYLVQRLDASGGRLAVALDKNTYAYLTR